MAGKGFLYYWDFENRIRQNRIAPAYSLFGEEIYLMRRAQDLLKATIIDTEDPGFAFHSMYYDDGSLNDFIGQARTIPMMASRQLMILKNSHKISAGELSLLESYFKHPASRTVLVFEFPPSYNPWRQRSTRLFKLMEKSTETYLFSHLREKDLHRFLEKLVQDQQVRIDSDATQVLCRRLGGNLEFIAHELEKLILLAGDERRIYRHDVEALVARHPSATIFEMLDALSERNVTLALSRLSALMDHGEPPLIIITMLYRHYQEVMTFKSLRRRGLSQSEIMSRMRLKPFQMRKHELAENHYSPTDIWQCLQLIGAAEERLKSMRVDQRTHMEMLIINLCAAGRSADGFRRTSPQA